MKKRLSLLLIALTVLPLCSYGQLWKRHKTVADINAQVAGLGRLSDVMNLINQHYVDTPNLDRASEAAVAAALKSLDPHSVYIAARDVQRANESLQGGFEGVGISFQIVDDTIYVTDVIDGGPCQKAGVAVGDKLLRIDGQAATGDSIDNNYVFKHLRGKKGTHVAIDMMHRGQVISHDIVRGNVPIRSVTSFFMVDDTIGYIRLERFARTSSNEFLAAMRQLKAIGMTTMILDLRGNTGGFLDIATRLSNEFLEKNNLIVYTQGRNSRRENYRANGRGRWRDGGLVVLIDENSASASEIVSGAIQDWDRGIILGRRSYGKGLVQHMYELTDGAQVRLTTARYYTPSGRCIQRPYNNGTDAYRDEIDRRYKHGELVSVDSIQMPDSLRYSTVHGRTVYGGGGIMPDYFVPMDTMRLTPYYVALRKSGLITIFPMQWADRNRGDERLKTFEMFVREYDSLQVDTLFAAVAAQKNIVRDTAYERLHPEQTSHTNRYLSFMLKAQIARALFGSDYYYLVMRNIDDAYLQAVDVVKKGKRIGEFKKN
ncbi:MAG: S41 family peptidase [Bacteroidales bacterium]|nr:S41 family peptidase [Bacteroidales bacterium]